jgi:endonuclease/exonuclease/phosphatase family metal-dependent hydrolase
MIKVATYNIRKAIGTDRRRKPERIIEILNEINADIVALQEADRRFGDRRSVLPFDMLMQNSHYVPVNFDGRPLSIGYHGNAILIKNTHMAIANKVISIPTIEPRGAVCADIAIKGKGFRVVGMHLDISGIRRRQQVRAILHAKRDDPLRLPSIVMGDLNDWSNHGRCFQEFDNTHRVIPTGPSFHSKRPIARLDRIMVSHDFHIHEAGVFHSPEARKASDHLPVWANLSLV